MTSLRAILASGSPRRRQLLATLGDDFDFDVHVPDVDETPRAGEAAEDLVLRLAVAKAAEVAARFPGRLVIAADTVIEHDSGEVLGKPVDEADARRMLTMLAGSVHRVVSGVAVRDGAAGVAHAFVEATELRLAALDPVEIDRYIAGGEPMGKAGAYAIQGEGGRHLELLSGSRSNVIGLPMERLAETLRNCPSIIEGRRGFRLA